MSSPNTLKEECLSIAYNVLNEYITYNHTPKEVNGYIICDEEHFTGHRLSKELYSMHCGVYVTLYINGRQRGRMGNQKCYSSNTAQEIIKNTISAAFQDPLQNPLTKEELKDTIIQLHLIYDITSYTNQAFNNKINGIIIQSGYRNACILPDIKYKCINDLITEGCKTACIQENESKDIYLFSADCF